ncbi:MAG: phospholipase [Firmicutes bacterium HGW-Firmicutes-15]|nr:MAG: phospholipase [Firmicutes bacterium HGW-Firmicutes-15]
MNFAEVTTASYMTTAKIILATTSPFQKLVDHQIEVVHSCCNQAAIEILINDGWLKEGKLLSKYLEQINDGATWADKGWKNVCHYYNPVTGLGFRGWPTAAEECTRYFALARTCLKQLHFEKAFFCLGAAVHLVQDLCVPYHSRNVILAGHHSYERWAEKHVEDYVVFAGGLYNDNMENAGEWVVANARASFDLFSLVKDSSVRGYHLATANMLPLTQRTTAGFFHYFLKIAMDFV